MKVLIANKPGSSDNILTGMFSKISGYECYTLNIPSQFLYESSKDIQPDLYILNKGYEGYEGIRVVKEIHMHKPDAIVIMISDQGSSTIHPKLSSINLEQKSDYLGINRMLNIFNKIKMQSQPGLRYYERKWCFFRLDITSIQYLLVNLLNNSSPTRINQGILAAAV